MNKYISKYFFYYPALLAAGETLHPKIKRYDKLSTATTDEIISYKTKKIKKLLIHAYNNSYFYRKKYQDYGVDPKRLNSLDDLNSYPIVTKEDIQNHASNMLTRTPSFFHLKKTTGGSTGKPVSIYKSHQSLACERAATWVGYRWAGVNIGDPQARFWGIPVDTMKNFKYKIIDIVANRIRLSAFNLNDSSMEVYLQEINHFRPKYLYGYVSAIYEFIVFLSNRNKTLPRSIKSIITTSEVLTPAARSFIEGYTGLKVYNEYGCGEVGSIAHECSSGSLHIMEQNIHAESIPKTGYYDSGNLLITDLNNHVMPLIRYEVGDFGELSGRGCKCGVNLQLVKNIHGRAYDFISLPDGTRVHPEKIIYIFEDLKQKGDFSGQFQVTQKNTNKLNILVTEKISSAVERMILDSISQKIYPFSSIKIATTNSIPRESSGKIRVVKSNVS